jgi:pimeloyl-ACP methyl ester carboxylesterase
VSPEIRYAKTEGVHIAYQVLGDGPPDLVVFLGWLTHAEALWRDRAMEQFLRRLSSFSRIVLFDKRGIGLSDPVPASAPPTLEQWMDDVEAVLNAIGSPRVSLLGHGTGGQMAMVYAATHPERVASLVLANTYARLFWAHDYPWGIPVEVKEATVARQEHAWGTPMQIKLYAPSVAGDDRVREWWAQYQRLAASPGTAVVLQRVINELDTRSVLPLIRLPTLILHRVGNKLVQVEHARYLADHIAGARYVELEGDDHWIWTGGAEILLDEVQEFLTGSRVAAQPDRVLATVLFTDIVGSTERAAQIGDRRWRDALDAHDDAVRKQLKRFRGREIKRTGDGFLATFDGPARAIQCANAVHEATQRLGIPIRAGLHTGEIELRGSDVAGIAVHIAARVAALANAGEVLVSSTVRDLVVGSNLEFADRGVRTLKGVPGEWQLLAVKAQTT